jgi:hypothetical protein
MVEDVNKGEARAMLLLQELRDLAEEMSWDNSTYASRVHDLQEKIRHLDICGIDKEMGFRVVAYRAGTREIERTIAACSNADIAIAAYARALEIYPDYRWLLLWGGMVQRDSKPLPLGE